MVSPLQCRSPFYSHIIWPNRCKDFTHIFAHCWFLRLLGFTQEMEKLWPLDSPFFNLSVTPAWLNTAMRSLYYQLLKLPTVQWLLKSQAWDKSAKPCRYSCTNLSTTFHRFTCAAWLLLPLTGPLTSQNDYLWFVKPGKFSSQHFLAFFFSFPADRILRCGRMGSVW